MDIHSFAAASQPIHQYISDIRYLSGSRVRNYVAEVLMSRSRP
jgi:hypothetical protein